MPHTSSILSSKPLKEALLNQVTQQAAELTQQNIPLKLAVVLVGENPASRLYVDAKQRTTTTCGMGFQLYRLPEDTTAEALTETLQSLNEDKTVSGILLQLPLPKHLDTRRAHFLNQIEPLKDVDGLTPLNTGKTQLEQPEAILPATPLGVMRLLDWQAVPMEGAQAVVVGRSHLVGQPLANLLMLRNATVTICHKKTKDLFTPLGQADIIILAAGAPHLIHAEHIKEGVVLIDVGITSRINEQGEQEVVGDAHPSCAEKARLLTPVPGGVGPMTVASLMTNVIDAARLQVGLPKHNWHLSCL